MQDLKLFFVTNRRPSGGSADSPARFGKDPHDEGVENLRFGSVVVPAEDRRMAEFRNPTDKDVASDLEKYLKRRVSRGKISLCPEQAPEGTNELRDPSKVVYGSTEMFDGLRKAMLEDRDILVYVHGYNTSWKDAVAGALTLQERLNAPDVRGDAPDDLLVVLFTWPSDGKKTPWVAYKSDRLDAAASGFAMGRALLKLRDFLATLSPELERDTPDRKQACGRRINVLCHSMGNFVLQNAIERMEIEAGGRRLPRLFEQVFLCAADVDDDVLQPDGAMRNLPDLCRGVHVFFNRGDLALAISDNTGKGNPERLGSTGAARPGELNHKIALVDCTPWVGGIAEHGYHTSRKLLTDARICMERPHDGPVRTPARAPFTWTL